MKNKLLSILVCLAMLVSSLGIFAYAATIDVEIDLGGLFDDEPVTEDPKENEGEDENKENEDAKPDKEDNKPSRPSAGTTTKNENEDEDVTSDEKKEEEVKEWTNPFSDVKENDWFYATVKYASENAIMNGVEADKFAPNNTLTRAMLVTILYRVEGSPRLESDSKFSDVVLSDWYGAPVIWASENGIVNGVTETEFAPNANITREQIAAIMYRYAKAKGYDVSEGENTNILSYEDADKISSYAVEALQYTAGSGIMKGKTESTLNPLDNATRAEAATVVMRFIEANK